jgi:uncharacterized protein (TIGR02145 family)
LEDKLNHNSYIKYQTISILFLLFTFFSIPKLNAQVDKKLVKEIEKLKERMELDPNFYFREYNGKRYVTESSSKINNNFEIITTISKSNLLTQISLDSIFLLNEKGILDWKSVRILPGGYKTDYYPERNIVYYPNKLILDQKNEDTVRIVNTDKLINFYNIETKEGLGFLFEFEYNAKKTKLYKHFVLLQNDLKPYLSSNKLNEHEKLALSPNQLNKLKLNLKSSSNDIPKVQYCVDGSKYKKMIGASLNEGYKEVFLDDNLNLFSSRMRKVEQDGKVYYCNLYEEITVVNNDFPHSIETLEFLNQSGFIDWKIITFFPSKERPSDIKGGKIVFFPKGLFFSQHASPRPYTNEYFLNIGSDMSVANCYSIETSVGKAYLIEFKKGNIYKHGVILSKELDLIVNNLKNKVIGVFSDSRDNQKYKYVKIDDLYWMSENLKFQTPETRLLEGEVYYTYYDAVSACPKGWHLPSDIEWKKLEKYLGVNDQWLDYLGSEYSRGDGVGEKQIGFELATNRELGFLANYSGYPSSFRVNEKGSLAYFWTRTKQDEVNAIIRVLGTDFTDGIIRDKSGVKNSFSCRCVKDTDINSIADNNQKIKAYLQKESEGKMTADDFYERSIEFLIIGEESRSFDDIENALKLDNSNLEYKLFKAQLLYLYQFNKEASQIRSLMNEYLTNINNNEFAYYLAYKSELYDYVNNEMKATNDKLRKQKALNYLESAIKLDPKNPYYMELKSKIHISNQEYGEAIKLIGVWLSLDPKNGEAHNWLGICKLKNFHEKNKSNKINAPEWCGMIAGCYKVTAVQLKEVCSHFYKAINYGFSVNPDYFSLCGELKSAELLEKHRPIIHTGPRGGRYTISASGNKVYIPRK